MRIRHSRLTKDFLQVPNATVRDDRMSHMARGILAELLSRPDGWQATADDMWQASVAKHGKDSPGRRQFRAAFAELKAHGYLTASRGTVAGGKHATILTLADVPQAGTSVRAGETEETAGRADVPHAGTSEGSTDVPDGGTPAPPAETNISAGRTDVPLSDVPPCGTSKEENGEKNTGLKNTSSSAAPASSQQDEEEDLSAFGAFWIVYPKSRDQEKTLKAWREAVAAGVDPQLIKAAAEAYARECAGKDRQYVKLSVNWLKDKRYNDRFDEPTPAGQPSLHVVGGQRRHQPFQPNPKANYSKGFGS